LNPALESTPENKERNVIHYVTIRWAEKQQNWAECLSFRQHDLTEPVDKTAV
jgi:hypothetical protein